jgi:phosphatidylserine decarboxylase
MSIKQGVKYDAPESARDIPAFIEFHNLNINEMLYPVEHYSTLLLSLLSQDFADAQ